MNARWRNRYARRIYRYFDGKMSDDEMKAFRQELRVNPVLLEEFRDKLLVEVQVQQLSRLFRTRAEGTRAVEEKLVQSVDVLSTLPFESW